MAGSWHRPNMVNEQVDHRSLILWGAEYISLLYVVRAHGDDAQQNIKSDSVKAISWTCMLLMKQQTYSGFRMHSDPFTFAQLIALYI